MFKFKGISSKDMQVVIEEEEHFIARASRRYETTEIEGRDGAIFNELGYSYVERPIYVQCLNIDKMDDILAWLDGEGEFEYKERKTTARFYVQQEPKREGYIRIIDTTFIRDPFWTKIDDKYIEVKGRKDNITERVSNLNVQDASGQNAKINVFGISKQETRSGKNILNATMSNNVINGITYTKNSDGSVTANGTATNTSYITVNGASPLELKANTQYRLTGCSKNGSNSTYMLVTNILGANTHYDTGNGITFSLEEDSDVNVNIRITAGTTVSNLIFYPMLRLANNGDDSFEQYGETPSLEYPSEIKNTGDNINIFNLEEYIEFYDLTETGTDEGHNYVAYTTKTYENNKFMQGKFKANTQYTISFLGRQKQAVQGQTSGFALNYTDGTSNIKYVNNDEVWTEYTLTSDKNKTIDYVSMAWAYGGTIWLSNIKLEEGTNATSYSNYGCGNVEITDCNKNLFNIETAMQNYILNDAGIEIASQGAFVSDYILVKKDVNYFSNTRGYTNAGFYDLDKNFIKRDTVAQNATTTFDDDYYIKLNGKMENINEFQFERNDTATDFEAHEEEVITFPLAQNQKMYKGDYLANDGIHHKRKQIAFDGTENWASYAGYANNAEKGYCYYLNIADCKIVKDTSISTHFKNVFGAYQESTGYVGAFSDNLSVKNKYFISDKETLEKFKAYLAEQKTAGTPVKLEYDLETEEIEAYTEEQQTQRDQLQNAKTYKTVTNVFTDNAEVEMNYIADTTEKIVNGGNIYSRPILRLEKTISNKVDITIKDIRFQYDFKDEEYVEIDCEEKEGKYEGLNRNRQLKIGYEFPKLKIGDNNIIMHEGDCIIKAKRKDRWL